MQIQLEKAALEEAVQTASRAISPKSPLPILSHVLLEAHGEHAKFTATNLDLGISLRIPAQVVEDGAVAVPARVFLDIVSKLAAQPVGLHAKDGRLHIHCGRSKFEIAHLPAEEFPKQPEAGSDEVQLPQRSFRRMVRQVSTATAATDESRAVMTGILTQFEGNSVRLVATDGRRLALAEQPLPEDETLSRALGGKASSDTVVIVPGKAMGEIARICADNDETLTLRIGESQLHCRVRDVSLHCRLLEGSFPDYNRVMPTQFSSTLRVGREALLAGLKRMLIVAQERQSPNLIVLDLREECLSLSANTPDLGLGQEEIAVIYEGRPLRIAFNGKYMLDLLSVLDAEEVQVRFQDDTRSAVLQEWGSEAFRYLLMPVRLREAVPEAEAAAVG